MLVDRCRWNSVKRCCTYLHSLAPAIVVRLPRRHGTLVVTTAQGANSFLLLPFRHKTVKILRRWRYNSGLKAGCNV